MPARIVALADAFDAMTSERPYRQPLSLGETLSELVHLSPQKFDPAAMQGLLIQLRRDAVGSNQNSFLDERIACNLAAGDIDNLAANLQHKLNHGKLYLT